VDDQACRSSALAPWDSDLNRASETGTKPEVLGLALVAEQGAVSGGKYRRHPPTFFAQLASSDRIYASMDLMQSTGLDPMPDCGVGVTDLKQLRSRNHSVLSANERPYLARHRLKD
jgi:hypothetical protein